LGVPAILTNHNKQTYANQALFLEPASISVQKSLKKTPYKLQLIDFESEKFLIFFISLEGMERVQK
jgi:hypothetical protein